MGAMATVDFLRKLVEATPAERDQEHIPLIVRFCPEVPDRAAALAGSGPSPQPALVAAAVELAAAGAQALAIPCNTAHYWYDALCAAVPIPILHIVDAALAELQRRGVSPQGRPKGELTSAQREGSFIFPQGRPKGEFTSAQREGCLILPQGRPKGESASAQREGSLPPKRWRHAAPASSCWAAPRCRWRSTRSPIPNGCWACRCSMPPPRWRPAVLPGHATARRRPCKVLPEPPEHD